MSERSNRLARNVKEWLIAVMVQSFVAAFGSMVIGFFPELLTEKLTSNSAFEPYSPAIAVVALLLGYFFSFRVWEMKGATSTWIVGLVWLGFGVYETAHGWNASWSVEPTVWQYVVANLFGKTSQCSGTECLGELIFTTPCIALFMYSLGAVAKTVRGSLTRPA
jgi:hypothetical protein